MIFFWISSFSLVIYGNAILYYIWIWSMVWNSIAKLVRKTIFWNNAVVWWYHIYFFSALQILIDIVLVGTSNEGFVIATNLHGWKIVLGDIYKTACFKGIGTLWFISSLFICNMIFHIQKKKKRTIVFDIVLLVFEGCVAYGIFLVLQTAIRIR